MNGTTALPGLATGVLGLAAGLVGLGLNAPSFGAVAGVLALASGVAGVRAAQQLSEQGALQALVEDELRKVRSEAKSTEAELRNELTSALAEQSLNEDYGPENYDSEEYGDGPDPLTDESTGLFSESFFVVALDSRIAAARRHLRPVAVVLLEVIEDLNSATPQPTDELLVAKAIQTTLREADTACRLRSGNFALLLEDTPENGAIWTVERVRRYLSDTNSDLTMWAGIACYPAHAFGSEELLVAANDALEAAREWRQDRIEVALVASD